MVTWVHDHTTYSNSNPQGLKALVDAQPLLGIMELEAATAQDKLRWGLALEGCIL